MDTKKRVLIFGGTGSLGLSLIQRLKDVYDVSIFSRDEAKHWTIKNQHKNSNLSFYVGDIRDYERVFDVLYKENPDIVIIASALKQVDTCELSPEESVKTNIVGPKNVINAVVNNKKNLSCDTVLFVSTDKACEPVNVYGMSKAISERIVTSNEMFHNDIRFLGVRYGNVLESRGSIIPLFKHQALYSDSLTVTHKDMTRFLMTLDQSVDLILNTINMGKSGEIWIPKLPSMKILDLANIFAKRYNKRVEMISIRPGEKIAETLVGVSESLRTREVDGHYIISPAHYNISSERPYFEYTSSDDVLDIDNLEKYLDEELGIIGQDIESFVGKKIEEIRI